MSTTTGKVEDILEEDRIQIPSQRYALISVVSPQSTQKHEQCGVKIRGAFGTKDEAEYHAKRLQKDDPNFDVYLVEMYKWLLIPPNNEMIEDHQFADKLLQDIVQGHKEQQDLSRQHHEERKREEKLGVPERGETSGESSGKSTETTKDNIIVTDDYVTTT